MTDHPDEQLPRTGPKRPRPVSIVEAIRIGTLDAELAALLWLLLEARVPLIVAGTGTATGPATLLDALLDLLPPGTRRVPVVGAAAVSDWFAWADPATSYLVGVDIERRAAEAADVALDSAAAASLVATRRLALRSLTRGFGLGGTIESGSLESVFERLRADDVGLTDDELTFLGVVLVVERTAPSAGGSGQGRVDRVVAAHYVRPLARDAAGHVQRLGPAVLATWEPRSGRFEHFAWGLIPELAVRVGRRAGDFELEQDRRREYLVVLAAGGVAGRDDVRAALDGFRLADTGTAAH